MQNSNEQFTHISPQSVTIKFALQRIAKFGLILMVGVSMSACSENWKEEVLLHDGSKLIVERSQTRGGRGEIGQSSPIKTHTITFSLPNSGKSISWVSEYGEDLGRTNFNLLALHAINGIPYIIVEPNLCLSYNKWGRPNPPYVFFKYDGKIWQRISLSEFPAEFKNFNLIINNGRKDDIEKAASKLGYVSSEDIQKINSSLRQPEYKIILREPLPEARIIEMCGEHSIMYKGFLIKDNPIAKKFIDQQIK